ncbi:hypothetical protein [Streptomyces sp. NPDC048269]|uniref:hypothetical protein n=1 Tax=Streptomyces sp. NPDC048269 TaxID=3155753 RepID=UPI00343BDE5A
MSNPDAQWTNVVTTKVSLTVEDLTLTDLATEYERLRREGALVKPDPPRAVG